MQEEVENRTVNLAITTTKLSARAIIAGIKKYLAHRKNKKIQHTQGKQSVKELIGQDAGVSTIDIAKTGLRDFQRVARKYNVDFAVEKDKTVPKGDPPRYVIFFKSRDADALKHVMKEYSAKELKRKGKNRPSVLKKLRHFKEIVAAIPRKIKEKTMEKER